MPPPADSRATARNVLSRFGRSRRGSAAVEFALVAPVFFALLFAIIESAIVFFAGQVLETITQDSARLIATGQAQTGQVPLCQPPGQPAPVPCTQATFKNYVCSQIPALFDCAGVYVDVRNYPAFTNVVINSQIDANKNLITNMQYSPGGPGAIVQPAGGSPMASWPGAGSTQAIKRRGGRGARRRAGARGGPRPRRRGR